MATPHIEANKEDIAPVVLFLGDPIRAKNAAERFLHDYKQVNSVRCAYGYTGYTKNNKRITIFTHGMGIPSMAIYAHELINFYGVKVIVRAGTCGAWQPGIKLLDLLIAEDAITNSNWPTLHGLPNDIIIKGDPGMLEYAKEAADEIGVNHFEGRIYTSDVFYGQKSLGLEKYSKQGVLGVEMETFGLYQIAQEFGIKALSILTVSDSLVYKEELTSEQRSKMRRMIEIGISILEKYA